MPLIRPGRGLLVQPADRHTRASQQTVTRLVGLGRSPARYHGAGVAARHVVENFYYHPGIQLAWRDRIASSFLDAWKTRTEQDIKEIGAPSTKKAKVSKTTAADTGRKLDGLQRLLDDWDTLANAYGTYVTAFSVALT